MIISVGSQKGGTGKTSTVFALGEILAGAYKKKVLMVDVDPQLSLTHAAGVKPGKTLADVLTGAKLQDAIIDLSDRLYLLPSSVALSEVELKLVGKSERASYLKKALAPVINEVDFILLDLPPSLGLLTVNGLTASDGVIIPSRPTMLDVAGLSLFLDTVQQARSLNKSLEVLGVLLTFYDPRIVSMAEIIKNLEAMKLHIFKTRIGQSIRVAEALGKSVVTYSPSNKRALEYVQFTSELLKVLK